ncbi:MAG: hypothetical protein H6746_08090 [Deltaproteobacteria bacterium]|nr:hypothetical protein [Deltaproteobacteria bacterium]
MNIIAVVLTSAYAADQRVGSAESVVLPVLLSPKNYRYAAAVADVGWQCMPSTPRAGSRVQHEDALHLAGAYSVPQISNDRRVKSTKMLASEWVLSTAGTGL